MKLEYKLKNNKNVGWDILNKKGMLNKVCLFLFISLILSIL